MNGRPVSLVRGGRLLPPRARLRVARAGKRRPPSPTVPTSRQPELAHPGRLRRARRYDGPVLRPPPADGVADGNWVQTDPTKGWFLLRRLYSPLPTFFDKTGRAGELDPVG
jgi:hypothetical protein